MGMLPEAEIRTEALDVSGFCQPAVEVGGDYYDYVALSEHKLGIIVGDVTGHGFYSVLLLRWQKVVFTPWRKSTTHLTALCIRCATRCLCRFKDVC